MCLSPLNEKDFGMKPSKERNAFQVHFLLVLLVMVTSVGRSVAFEGLGDIHDEKYSCPGPDGSGTGSEMPSERRVLLVSPQKHYLAQRSTLLDLDLTYNNYNQVNPV